MISIQCYYLVSIQRKKIYYYYEYNVFESQIQKKESNALQHTALEKTKYAIILKVLQRLDVASWRCELLCILTRVWVLHHRTLVKID